jgi:hypothetical protein
MKRELKNLVHVARQYPELSEAVLAFAKAVEVEISTLEMELLHRDSTISRLIKDEMLHLRVMNAYGIDVRKLGARSMYRIMADIDFAENHGSYLIPEKIRRRKK